MKSFQKHFSFSLACQSRDLDSVKATQSFASCWLPWLRRGDVVALHGDLGVGKTSFARGLIAAAMRDNAEFDGVVPSPSYTLVQVYETPAWPLWHFDLYRLRRAEEILELGLEDALQTGVCLVEWPSRAEEFLPKNRCDVFFSIVSSTKRKVSWKADSAWARRKPRG